MKWLQTYTGFLRNIRLFHFIYNFLNRDKLQHNKILYLKYGLKKSIYSSISSKDFKNKAEELPWLDTSDDTDLIKAHPNFKNFDASTQQALLKWQENGFLVLPNFFDDDTINTINQEVERLMQNHFVQFNYTNKKIFNAFQFSESISNLINAPKLIAILEFILGKTVFPFQTLNFIQGSEQAPHSDFIHMSTFPKGNLIAAWIALEDIQMEAGALEYYPGSHKLDYLNNELIGTSSNCLLLDGNANKKNEIKTAQLLKDYNLKSEVLLVKKGAVLVWHANLVHGGLPITNPELSRKSLVVHYYAKEVICYHEISERPSLIPPKKL